MHMGVDKPRQDQSVPMINTRSIRVFRRHLVRGAAVFDLSRLHHNGTAGVVDGRARPVEGRIAVKPKCLAQVNGSF